MNVVKQEVATRLKVVLCLTEVFLLQRKETIRGMEGVLYIEELSRPFTIYQSFRLRLTKRETYHRTKDNNESGRQTEPVPVLCNLRHALGITLGCFSNVKLEMKTTKTVTQPMSPTVEDPSINEGIGQIRRSVEVGRSEDESSV
ncbi:hypothetical protein J6590_008157 [Homalodisca vitripennis]|nr:hypothetical protein J6590_008157 [Homalodisca vitripennis]